MNSIKIFCKLLILIIVSNKIVAQGQKTVNSLKIELNKFEVSKQKLGNQFLLQMDTVKVKLLFDLAEQLYLEKPQKAIDVVNQGLLLSKEINYDSGIADAYKFLGLILDYKAKYKEAIQYFKKSLKIQQTIGDYHQQVGIYNNIGSSYCKTGNYPEAMNNFLKGLAIAKKINFGFGILGSYNNIGLAYSNQGMYDEALNNYMNCLNLQMSQKNNDQMCQTYGNIGEIFVQKKQFDLAMTYFQKGFELAKKQTDIESEIYNLMGIAKVHLEKKQYKTALNNFKLALNLSIKSESQSDIADAKLQLGYSYFKVGENEKAKTLVAESLTMLNQSGDIEMIATGLKYLTEIDESSGNFKAAFENNVLYQKYHDSIYNIEKNKKFRELQVKYDLKSIKDIANAKEVSAKKELQNQKNIRYYSIAGMGLLVFFLIVVIFQRTKIAKIQKQKALVQERSRISRNLHDNLGTQLSTARIFISSLKNNKTLNTNETLDNSIELLDTSINDLRLIMNEMHTSELINNGYIAATENFINKINQMHKIKFSLVHHKIEKRFEQRLEHELYSVTQELINNTLKHANALNVSLNLVHRGELLVFIYEDDGIGFDNSKITKGNGLENIKTRIKAINGSVEFDSSPNNGARTIIEIPYKNA